MPTKQQRIEAAAKTLHQTGSLLKAAGSFAFPSSMAFQGRSSWLSIAPRNFPYHQTDPLSNSAVVNTLGWITRNFGQAEFHVARQKRDGSEEPIINHPLQQLLENPNANYEKGEAGYGGQTLWAVTLLSYHLDGNAYWIKERNARGFGLPTRLWYVPHWMIKPVWPDDGSKFISEYEYSVNGRVIRLPVRDVVHFRNGLNPANTRYGLAPLKAALLQVFTDTEVTLWIAALCKNMAIPGVVINPRDNIGMTEEKARQIIEKFKRKFGGDNKGEPGVLDFAADISVLGFDPKSMDFAAIHHHAESRIAGALGVPPQLVYLDVANDSSSYNNLTTFERIGWEQGIVPSYENLEDTLDSQLLIDFETDPIARGIFCEFDTSEVRALKEDQNAKEERILKRVAAGLMTVAEAQAELGQKPDPAATYYLIPSSLRPVTSAVALARANTAIEDPKPPTPSNPNADPKPEPKKSFETVLPPPLNQVFNFNGMTGDAKSLADCQKDDLPYGRKAIEWEGLTLRREPTDLEKLCIKGIDEEMTNGQQTLSGFLSNLRDGWFDELAAEFDDEVFSEPELLRDVQPTITDDNKAALTAILLTLFAHGAALIATELALQGAELTAARATITATELAGLVAATLTKVANDVRARAVASAVAAVQLGLNIADKIRSDARDSSTGYVSRAAGEATNLSLARGRDAEIAARSSEIQFLVYSAVLDSGTCTPCGEVDGKTGQKSELPSVPNPQCEGGAQCRCVLIAVRKPD